MNIFYLVHFLFSLNRSSHKQGKHQKIFIILTNIPVYPANMQLIDYKIIFSMDTIYIFFLYDKVKSDSFAYSKKPFFRKTRLEATFAAFT